MDFFFVNSFVKGSQIKFTLLRSRLVYRRRKFLISMEEKILRIGSSNSVLPSGLRNDVEDGALDVVISD